MHFSPRNIIPFVLLLGITPLSTVALPFPCLECLGSEILSTVEGAVGGLGGIGSLVGGLSGGLSLGGGVGASAGAGAGAGAEVGGGGGGGEECDACESQGN